MLSKGQIVLSCILSIIGTLCFYACEHDSLEAMEEVVEERPFDICDSYPLHIDLAFEYESSGYSSYGDFRFEVDLDIDSIADIYFSGHYRTAPVDANDWATQLEILNDEFELYIETAWDTLCLDTMSYTAGTQVFTYYVIKDCLPGEFSSITEYKRPVIFEEDELEQTPSGETSGDLEYINLGDYDYQGELGALYIGTIYHGIEWNGPREAFLLFTKTTADSTTRYALKLSGAYSSSEYLTVEEVRNLDCPE